MIFLICVNFDFLPSKSHNMADFCSFVAEVRAVLPYKAAKALEDYFAGDDTFDDKLALCRACGYGDEEARKIIAEAEVDWDALSPQIQTAKNYLQTVKKHQDLNLWRAYSAMLHRITARMSDEKKVLDTLKVITTFEINAISI